jgi:hypothetical protein
LVELEYLEAGAAAQSHIFDLRHASMDPKDCWLVQVVDDKRQLAELVHRKQLIGTGHSDIDATEGTMGGEDVRREHASLGLSSSVEFEDMILNVGNTTFVYIQRFLKPHRLDWWLKWSRRVRRAHPGASGR